MEISKMVISKTGKKVDCHICISDAKVSGTAVIDGSITAKITGYAVVNGYKCLMIKGGPAPYLPISDSLYHEIDQVVREQYRQSKSQEQLAWEAVCAAEADYRRISNHNDSWADVCNAQARYEQALSEFRMAYPNSKYLQSNRVSYVLGDVNPWTD